MKGTLHQPLEPGTATKVEGKARPDAAGPTPPLFQVGLGGPHCGVVGHVVVGREQLHLGPSQKIIVMMVVIMMMMRIIITHLYSKVKFKVQKYNVLTNKAGWERVKNGGVLGGWGGDQEIKGNSF